MPLLTELERGFVGPRIYEYAAPNGAVTHVPRRAWRHWTGLAAIRQDKGETSQRMKTAKGNRMSGSLPAEAGICPGGTSELRPARSRGFTLLEMLGVVVITAILAAAVIPTVIRHIDQAALTKEVNNMGAISNALVLQVLKSRTCFDQISWSQVAANWTMFPPSQILTNNRNFPRALLIDNSGWLTNFSAGSPYPQTPNGTPALPYNARYIIVSTIATGHLPVGSGTLSSVFFNDIWNTPAGVKPSSSLWTSWTGSGQDLVVQRINIQPLFYQLILVNRDPGSTNASFSINGTSATAIVVTNGNIWNSYYIAGSVLGLYSTNIFATSYVLQRNISFVYENGAWGGQIMDCLTCTNPPPTGSNLVNNFTAAASNFLNAAWYSTSKADSQQVVLADMANFMLDYPMLANTAPPFTMYTAKNVPGWELDSIWNAIFNNNVDADSRTMAPGP